jgi:hypothetical protein
MSLQTSKYISAFRVYPGFSWPATIKGGGANLIVPRKTTREPRASEYSNISVWVGPNSIVLQDQPPMKALSISLSLIFAAGFFQSAAGIECSESHCAACWKIGSSVGEDIKLLCAGGKCADWCPDGYDRIHCAKSERCSQVIIFT